MTNNVAQWKVCMASSEKSSASSNPHETTTDKSGTLESQRLELQEISWPVYLD